MNRIRFVCLIWILVMLSVSCTKPLEDANVEEIVVPENAAENMENDPKNDYKNRLIRIGAIQYYPPYEYYEDGQMTGAGIEVVREAFTRLGYDFEIKPYPWARMIKMLQTGDLDVIINIYETTDRNEFLYFSETPYVVVPYVFFKRKDFDFQYSGDIEELEALKIGIVRDYSYGSKFNKLIQDEALEFDMAPSTAEAFERLNTGRVDLVIETYYTGIGIISERGYTSTIDNLDYYINFNMGRLGFSKRNQLKDLVDEYDSMIYDMINDGVYYEIFEAFNVDPPIAK